MGGEGGTEGMEWGEVPGQVCSGQEARQASSFIHSFSPSFPAWHRGPPACQLGCGHGSRIQFSSLHSVWMGVEGVDGAWVGVLYWALAKPVSQTV